MSCHALCAADQGMFACKKFVNGHGLEHITLACAGCMRVDIVDIRSFHSRVIHCALHGPYATFIAWLAYD